MLLGQADEPSADILELKCNVDDMTGEAIGFALEQLLERGALDAFTTSIGMKKSRPGVMITVLCREADREIMVQQLLTHTTTLGIREYRCRRHTLQRRVETVDSPWGPVRKKVSFGYGLQREKYEHDDLARIARDTGLSLSQILAQLP